MKVYRAILVRPVVSIFQIAPDRTADMSKLSPDLVVSACYKVDFDKVIIFTFSYHVKVEFGELGIFVRFRPDKGFVLNLIPPEVVLKVAAFLGRHGFNNGPIGFMNSAGL